MTLGFTERGWEDYGEWQRLDPRGLRRLNALIQEAMRTPYEGTGKLEALKHDLAGWWPRRITDEHRLVYRVVDNALTVVQCRGHY